MLIVNAVSGNIYENAELAKKFQEVKAKIDKFSIIRSKDVVKVKLEILK